MEPDAAWVQRLLRAEAYGHPVTRIELIETHISWVILTGSFVYKLKKPLDLGFLDFSSLDKRRSCAEAEVRLNQALAPGIYLGVVPVTGSRDQPHLEGDGPVLDWAVKMVQFPQQAQLDRIMVSGGLSPAQMDAFAHRIAQFHQSAERVGESETFGNPDAVFEPVAENFRQIRDSGVLTRDHPLLSELEQWSRTLWQALIPDFIERKRLGFIRQCHGDLHLRNLAWIEDQPVAFDCIEFNPNLSRIDVLSDVAFLVMDLQDRGETALANRFLNEYLQGSGDYEQLQILPFYLAYRALVRAKVTAIRLGQRIREAENFEDTRCQDVEEEVEDTRHLYQELNNYLELASSYSKHESPALLLTCGLSGSGKTTISTPLVEQLGAIRIRSDVERKRLHGLQAQESGQADVGKGIYDAESDGRTYQRLQFLARKLLLANRCVIVDATFLDRARRQPFQQLAVELGCDYLILETTAPPDVLRQRLRSRQNDASDADISVLEAQLSRWPTLEPDEASIRIDTSEPLDRNRLVSLVQARLSRGRQDQ